MNDEGYFPEDAEDVELHKNIESIMYEDDALVENRRDVVKEDEYRFRAFCKKKGYDYRTFEKLTINEQDNGKSRRKKIRK